MLTPSDPRVSLRPISLPGTDGEGGGDLPFLRDLYASTRREEMALSGWPDDQIEAFLTQQFEAQHIHYMQHYPDSDFDLILFDEDPESKIQNPRSKIQILPIGRLYLDEREDEFRVIDIALLSEWRGKKIGGRLMRDVLDLARKKDKAVRIHVEPTNLAKHLYERLGFRQLDSNGVYDLMEWTAPAVATL